MLMGDSLAERVAQEQVAHQLREGEGEGSPLSPSAMQVLCYGMKPLISTTWCTE